MSDMTITQRRRLVHGASWLFLTVVGLTMVLPLFWMMVTSLKRPADDVLDTKEWWPRIPWRIEKTDVRSWPLFCRELVEQGAATSPSPGRRVWQLIQPRARNVFIDVSKRDPTPVPRNKNPRIDQVVLEMEISAMRVALHNVIRQKEFYTDEDFTGVSLQPPSRRMMDKLDDSRPDHLALRNRLILDASFPEHLVPTHRFQTENYKTVMVETNFARALFNSSLVTILVTLGAVFTSSLAAFAFARLHWAGRDKIFLSYLATMMIPAAVTIIPAFILMRELRWVNTYWGLILPVMFTAWGTFMLRQFFMSIPRDLEDAAQLDGCSTWGIYRHVVIPLSKPALAALTILTFMGTWREFMWPLIVTNTPDMFTLPVALAGFSEMYGIRWTLMMAGSVIMIVPMIVVFVFGQRYFMEGIKLGALKG